MSGGALGAVVAGLDAIHLESLVLGHLAQELDERLVERANFGMARHVLALASRAKRLTLYCVGWLVWQNDNAVPPVLTHIILRARMPTNSEGGIRRA